MSVTVRPRPGRRLARARVEMAARRRSTPGRLLGLLTVTVVIAVGFGTAAVVGVQQRAARTDDVRQHSGPLTVRTQRLYRALSDADATAATAFLRGGTEPRAARRRYQGDIATAARALATAADSTDARAHVVAQLSAQLPVYTGLVETARVYNRQGLPLGAAYLREASGLMRTKLLPAARRLYRAESDQLSAEREAAAGFPWLAVPVGLLLVGVLVAAQLYLKRRTNRILNPGLLSATAATLVALMWLGVSWAVVFGHLDAARQDGSTQVRLYAQSRLLALQARADESLTLVARGNGSAFERDFQRRMADLVGAHGHGGLLGRAEQDAHGQLRSDLARIQHQVTAWRAAHHRVRQLDDGGRYPDAVRTATGAGSGSAATAFQHLDDSLAAAIANANHRFDDQARMADAAQTGAAVGLSVLAVLAALASAVGIQRRVAEYR